MNDIIIQLVLLWSYNNNLQFPRAFEAQPKKKWRRILQNLSLSVFTIIVNRTSRGHRQTALKTRDAKKWFVLWVQRFQNFFLKKRESKGCLCHWAISYTQRYTSAKSFFVLTWGLDNNTRSSGSDAGIDVHLLFQSLHCGVCSTWAELWDEVRCASPRALCLSPMCHPSCSRN